MIPTRIRHKGFCEHAQTPYARRKCRAALIARITREQQEVAVQQPQQYQPGDKVEVGDDTIILARRKGSAGVRWSWILTHSEEGGTAYYPTPQEAIESARRSLGDLCWCGKPAEVNTGTRRTCVGHAG